MITAVLDTSVAVSWYLEEAFSREAREWQRRLLEGKASLLVPSLHFSEFGNVMRTHVKRKVLSPAIAREIYDLHLEAPLDIVNPPKERLLECALEYDATVYDAVYIQLALTHQVPFVTAERTTTPWVAKLDDLVVPLS